MKEKNKWRTVKANMGSLMLPFLRSGYLDLCKPIFDLSSWDRSGERIVLWRPLVAQSLHSSVYALICENLKCVHLNVHCQTWIQKVHCVNLQLLCANLQRLVWPCGYFTRLCQHNDLDVPKSVCKTTRYYIWQITLDSLSEHTLWFFMMHICNIW